MNACWIRCQHRAKDCPALLNFTLMEVPLVLHDASQLWLVICNVLSAIGFEQLTCVEGSSAILRSRALSGSSPVHVTDHHPGALERQATIRVASVLNN